MKSPLPAIAWLLLVPASADTPPIRPAELVGPKIHIDGDVLGLTVEPSVAGRHYQLQQCDTLVGGTWVVVGPVHLGDGTNLTIDTGHDPAVPRRFYRLALDGASSAPDGFALIPAGAFQMGDASNPRVGDGDELPVHAVQVSAFYMATHEVTKALWDEVRTWGLDHGYTDLPLGGGKAADHPVHTISWHAMVKWCNARSQKEDLTPCYSVGGTTYKIGDHAPVCNWNANGHRLPTEAEWEKAARGGLGEKNFPWGDAITHAEANYRSGGSYSYDLNTEPGYHPTYEVGNSPYTSPVGSFAANGYGLHDMAGNVWEGCWDWYAAAYYASSPGTDPRGPAAGSNRVFRGGSWNGFAYVCRAAVRYNSGNPQNAYADVGFRTVRAVSP